jgi:hypothetical protein
MSETQIHVGKLIPTNLTDDYFKNPELYGFDSFEELEEDFNAEKRWNPNYTWLDFYTERLGSDYVFYNGIIYKIEDALIDDDTYCNIMPFNDGSFEYYARYYNGGTYLSEVLMDSLESSSF